MKILGEVVREDRLLGKAGRATVMVAKNAMHGVLTLMYGKVPKVRYGFSPDVRRTGLWSLMASFGKAKRA